MPSRQCGQALALSTPRRLRHPQWAVVWPTFAGVLSALETTNGYYESAINNPATNAGTRRIYATFSGRPRQQAAHAANHRPTHRGCAGLTLVAQVFLCANGAHSARTMSLVAARSSERTLSSMVNLAPIFSRLVIMPGQLLNITEVFHFVGDSPGAHLAGAILVDPPKIP